MLVVIKIFFESIRVAFQELRSNLFRSFLSLLGVTIGIFCIVGILTAINSFQMYVSSSVQAFGNDVVYIQKWPWIMGREYPWWEFYRRPVPNHDEMEVIKERVNLAKAASFNFYPSVNIKYNGKEIENITCASASHDFGEIRGLTFSNGRYFTDIESYNGNNVVILGNTIAESVFKNTTDNIGRTIKIDGRKATVIGVLEKQGEDLFNFTMDEQIIIPYKFAESFINTKGDNGNPTVIVQVKEGVNPEDLMSELKGVLRAHRKIAPGEDDNFALNKVSIISNQFDQLFVAINIAGVCITILSMIVGIFGIANIMFVSVKERTRIIGIKKALGAKKRFILIEFLTEAIVLCLLGGFIGVALVFGLMVLVQNTVYGDGSVQLAMSKSSIIVAVALSVGAGLVSGLAPAISAAYMKPVDAIRK